MLFLRVVFSEALIWMSNNSVCVVVVVKIVSFCNCYAWEYFNLVRTVLQLQAYILIEFLYNFDD